MNIYNYLQLLNDFMYLKQSFGVYCSVSSKQSVRFKMWA